MNSKRLLDLSRFYVGSLSHAENDTKDWQNSNLARVRYHGQIDFFDLPRGTTSDDFEEAAIDHYSAYSDAVTEDEDGGWIRVDLEDKPGLNDNSEGSL